MAIHKVRFQPVDIEIEVSEDETVLNAAFRQGVSLTHGCREGQCGACKSFLLDGDLEMKKYSTFALPDYESEEGYVLLCRSHVYSDAEVELINYDEDILRLGIPIETFKMTIDAIEPLTHDIRRLVLKFSEEGKKMRFNAGQYASIRVPGSDEYRAYSMANTPRTLGRLEFMIKMFPDGLFSGLLDNGFTVGQELEIKGPYGVFMLREKWDSDIVCIGGGSGMAPLWSLLNDMAERGIKRKATYFYGARTRKDLFYLDHLHELEEKLPGFRFIPALSMPTTEDEWDGETGLITEVLDRHLEGDQSFTQAYLCGPPPMIDAAIPVLVSKGISEDRIFYDKFTPTFQYP
ncbi:MAG TPA: 2Fe-2S iron-sulfur cluster binding domain-containing protein [Ktedonobacteraceae bacterium]|nr:2Fe-2S iron-sulfur cluster binding domain-containing protein [Ktedonobacteraceae bacterium]